MRLATSHTFFNKKLDGFGHDHDASIKEMMDLEQRKLKQTFPVENEETIWQKNVKQTMTALHCQKHHNETFDSVLDALKTILNILAFNFIEVYNFIEVSLQ